MRMRFTGNLNVGKQWRNCTASGETEGIKINAEGDEDFEKSGGE